MGVHILITKLPKWVEIGAFTLSILAGSVNTIGLVGFSHHTLSHFTGTISELGVQVVNFDWMISLHLGMILLSFFVGTIFSGYYIKNSALKLGRRYGVALLMEGILLILAMLFLKSGSQVGCYFASGACGLQNAMVTTYSGAVIRTTHITGLLTDLGIMFGARFRGISFDKRLAVLYLIILTGFMFGSIIGAVGFNVIGFDAFVIPTTLAIGLSVIYWFYLRQHENSTK